MQDLKVKSSGPEVHFAQARLIALGYRSEAPTGQFDHEMSVSVRLFQRDAGLPASGHIDQGTWIELLDTRTTRFVNDEMADQVAVLNFGEPDLSHPGEPQIGETDPDFQAVDAGQGGDRLEDAQVLLRAAGFAVEDEDALGPSTAAAIRAFQDSRFLEPTGALNEETWTALRIATAGASLISFAAPADLEDQSGGIISFSNVFRDVQGTGGYVYRQYDDGGVQMLRSPEGRTDGRVLYTGAAWRAITAEIGAYPTPRASDGFAPVARGATGEAAKVVQKRLNALGFGPLDEDGIYGGGTANAVKRFQEATGLTASGDVDTITAAKLKSPWDTLAPGSVGDAVTWCQRRLAALGFSPGPIDGDYGNGTATAVRTFQAKAGLPVTGILDERTRGHLVAGQTVGVPGDLLAAERERLAAAAKTAAAALPAAERAKVEPVVLEAVKWYGLKEIPKGSNKGPEIGPITEGTYGAGQDGPPWCALAVCLWVRKGLGLSDWSALPWGYRNAHALTFGNWGEKKGCLVAPSQTAPAGSIFVMYRAGSGSDAAGGRSASLKKWEGPGHTGIVIADLGDRVLTIEGNVGDRVWTGSRKKTELLGYIAWWR